MRATRAKKKFKLEPQASSKAPRNLKEREPSTRAAFRCDVCSQISLVWLHRCPKCSQFNTFNSEIVVSKDYSPIAKEQTDNGSESASSTGIKKKDEKALFSPIGEIDPIVPPRIPTGDDGLNHVLGGGIVMGSIVMLFGWPGAGKSTLSTSVAACVANTFPVWYAIGEHGKERVRRMADRLKLFKYWREAKKNLVVLDEVSKDTDTLCKYLKERKPQPVMCVVDSLMSIQSENATGASGGPTQVKYATTNFRSVSEDTGMAMLLIAHVTNDGSLAGPSFCKHLVDTLLTLEHVKLIPDKEDGSLQFKQIPKKIPGKLSFLRLAAQNKNRDGDVGACAYYRMTTEGLKLIALADEERMEWVEDPYKMLQRSTILRGENDQSSGPTTRQSARHGNRRNAARRPRRQTS
jgi:hypothetical protein